MRLLPDQVQQRKVRRWIFRGNIEQILPVLFTHNAHGSSVKTIFPDGNSLDEFVDASAHCSSRPRRDSVASPLDPLNGVDALLGFLSDRRTQVAHRRSQVSMTHVVLDRLQIDSVAQ